ncbi:MAG: hypothetical protein ACI4S2_09935 [Lachnospiraceae bacterium]
MEDRFDNENDQNAQNTSQPVYTDPNADVRPESEEPGGFQYHYGENDNSGGQYQNNYDYNTSNDQGYTQNYEQGMDTSPMSMGDWLLTILVSMIPCAGLVLYLVWAFGKTGNINRRNFCRANLIITAGVFVLYLILVLVFGIAFISGGR